MVGQKKSVKKKFEFLPHTADAKFRAYGKNIEECFVNAALAVTAIMFDYSRIKPLLKKEVSVNGRDLKALLYNWIEELLYLLDAEGFVLGRIEQLQIKKKEGNGWLLTAVLIGDTDQGKYEVIGPVVKAATYNEMEISDDY
ncbi:MAG: archease, partial [Candidatus Woesearchaeota archaeon]